MKLYGVVVVLSLWVCIIGIANCRNIQDGVGVGVDGDTRNSKVLPFLAVVSFPNLECSVNGNNGMSNSNGLGNYNDVKGVCFTKKQCRERQGRETSTTCAQKYGICCVFEKNCTDDVVVVKNNLTTLSSVNNQRGCNYVIPKPKGVCQLRLDFQNFMVGSVMEYANQAPEVPGGGGGPPGFIPPPTDLDATRGECSMEKLTISPTQNLPDGLTLCGAAKDQHLYLHYGNSDKITLGLSLLSPSMSTYSIKVTQIKCNSPDLAPQGCTQWYKEKSRRITSFNYPYAQLNRQMYAACIDNTEGAGSIRWQGCPLEPGKITSFFVSGETPGVEKSGTTSCKTDFVLLPGTDNERYCGGNFTKIQESHVIPFKLWVNFDNEEIPKELANPSTEIDPVTGCPLGYSCTIPQPVADIGKDYDCNANEGACFPSVLLRDQVDNYNLGFCLNYSVQ